MVWSACTTKKNTWATRTYHNTTNRWNLHFNANEAYKEGVDKMEKNKEDYTKLLPIFYYGTSDNAKSIYPEMDKAIKKASTAIQRHSIFIKGKEYCKWVDDNYLLIGKSNFYKRDYFEAIEDFDYVAKQYKNQSTHYEAELWLTRCHLELGNLEQVQLMFNIIDEDKKFPKKEKAQEIALLHADFYMKQKNYELCAEHLSKALKLTKQRKYKIRYNYILAQLYAQTGDNKKASKHYDQVLKLKPSNDMLFYAKINRVKVYDLASGSAKIRKELIKMSRDPKYDEFKDQIYYALAELSEREGNREDEIKYLKLCVKSSTTNQTQKALAYLKLGNLYYGEENYRAAQLHYDSAFISLPKDFPNYSDIDLKRKSLNKLITNLDIIQREDSLQGLAKMSDKEREAYIDKHIQKLLKDYEKKKQDAADAEAVAANNSSSPSAANAANSTGSWYFYNPTTMALGEQDFKKKWGDRKLEDNWRRSNKETVLTTSFDSTGNLVVQSQDAKEEAELNKIKDVSQYTKDIPKGDSAIAQSNDKIIQAYNNAGNIYREELENNPKAIAMFEELLARYPENKYKLPTYYQLYRLYLTTNNTAQAEKYKNIILKDYEFTEYGQLVSNPDYNVQAEKARYKAEQLYEQAYEDYKDASYNSVVIICNTALRLYKNNEYTAKFEYLRAVALGKTESLEAMETGMRNIIEKYPTDPVKPQAELVLKMIEQKYGKIQKDSLAGKNDSTEIFKYYIDAELFYVMLFPDKWRKNEDIKNRVSLFNDKFFSTTSLNTTNLMLNDKTQMIIVKQFPNKAKGLDYLTAIKDNTDVFKELDKSQVQQFVIAPDNFAKLYQTKKVDEYLRFFEKTFNSEKKVD